MGFWAEETGIQIEAYLEKNTARFYIKFQTFPVRRNEAIEQVQVRIQKGEVLKSKINLGKQNC